MTTRRNLAPRTARTAAQAVSPENSHPACGRIKTFGGFAAVAGFKGTYALSDGALTGEFHLDGSADALSVTLA